MPANEFIKGSLSSSPAPSGSDAPPSQHLRKFDDAHPGSHVVSWGESPFVGLPLARCDKDWIRSNALQSSDDAFETAAMSYLTYLNNHPGACVIPFGPLRGKRIEDCNDRGWIEHCWETAARPKGMRGSLEKMVQDYPAWFGAAENWLAVPSQKRRFHAFVSAIPRLILKVSRHYGVIRDVGRLTKVDNAIPRGVRHKRFERHDDSSGGEDSAPSSPGSHPEVSEQRDAESIGNGTEHEQALEADGSGFDGSDRPNVMSAAEDNSLAEVFSGPPKRMATQAGNTRKLLLDGLVAKRRAKTSSTRSALDERPLEEATPSPKTGKRPRSKALPQLADPEKENSAPSGFVDFLDDEDASRPRKRPIRK